MSEFGSGVVRHFRRLWMSQSKLEGLALWLLLMLVILALFALEVALL